MLCTELIIKYSNSIFVDIQKYYEVLYEQKEIKPIKYCKNVQSLLNKCKKLIKKYDVSIPEEEMESLAKYLDIHLIIQENGSKEVSHYNTIGRRKTFHFIKDLVVGDIIILQLYDKRIEENGMLTSLCAKFAYDPTDKNLRTLGEKLKQRAYAYRFRDSHKIARYSLLNDISGLEDYTIDLEKYDPLIKSIIYNEGKPLNDHEQQIHNELNKLNDLNGKMIKNLTMEDLSKLEECITATKQPIWISSSMDHKLLVTEKIECKTITFNDLCAIIIHGDLKCKYCNAEVTLIHDNESKLPPTTLTIDAVYPIYGHCLNNSVLCCLQCNIRKGMNYSYSSEELLEEL